MNLVFFLKANEMINLKRCKFLGNKIWNKIVMQLLSPQAKKILTSIKGRLGQAANVEHEDRLEKHGL